MTAGALLAHAVCMATISKPTTRDETRHEIGKLCLGGDWACAHGDLETLGHIAQSLTAYAHEPLHCELLALADLCRCDSDRATAAWVRLKELMQARSEQSST